MKAYNIENTKLIIKQNTTDLKKDILNEINSEKASIDQKDITIATLKKEIANSVIHNDQVLPEVKILFPEIMDISLAKHVFNEGTSKAVTIPVMIYYTERKLSANSIEKLSSWLRQNLASGKLLVYEEVVPRAKRR